MTTAEAGKSKKPNGMSLISPLMKREYKKGRVCCCKKKKGGSGGPGTDSGDGVPGADDGGSGGGGGGDGGEGGGGGGGEYDHETTEEHEETDETHESEENDHEEHIHDHDGDGYPDGPGHDHDGDGYPDEDPYEELEDPEPTSTDYVMPIETSTPVAITDGGYSTTTTPTMDGYPEAVTTTSNDGQYTPPAEIDDSGYKRQ